MLPKAAITLQAYSRKLIVGRYRASSGELLVVLLQATSANVCGASLLYKNGVEEENRLNTYQYILNATEEAIKKQSNFRNSISPSERCLIL